LYVYLISSVHDKFPAHLILLDWFTLIILVRNTNYEAPVYAVPLCQVQIRYFPQNPVNKYS
jgi:hypothetical protein